MKTVMGRSMKSLNDKLKHLLSLALATALALPGLTSCGIGVGGDDSFADQQARDNQKLTERYNMVQGVYEGNIVDPSGVEKPLAATLILQVNYESSGPNPNGEERIRPVLQGRFRLNDYYSPTDLLSLGGNYDVNGKLSLTSRFSRSMPGGGASGNNPGPAVGEASLELTGDVLGEEVALKVLKNDGMWGQFEAKRKKLDTATPIQGEEREYAQKICRILSPLVGDYYGVVDSPVSGGPQRVRIQILMPDEGGSTVGRTTIPKLIALFEFLSTGSLPRNMEVAYDSLTKKISMRTSGSDFFGSIMGSWNNGVLDATVQTSRVAGPIRVKVDRSNVNTSRLCNQ